MVYLVSFLAISVHLFDSIDSIDDKIQANSSMFIFSFPAIDVLVGICNFWIWYLKELQKPEKAWVKL